MLDHASRTTWPATEAAPWVWHGAAVTMTQRRRLRPAGVLGDSLGLAAALRFQRWWVHAGGPLVRSMVPTRGRALRRPRLRWWPARRPQPLAHQWPHLQARPVLVIEHVVREHRDGVVDQLAVAITPRSLASCCVDSPESSAVQRSKSASWRRPALARILRPLLNTSMATA